jgi:hypothetical protein
MVAVTKKILGCRLASKEVDFDLPPILMALARLNLRGLVALMWVFQ